MPLVKENKNTTYLIIETTCKRIRFAFMNFLKTLTEITLFSTSNYVLEYI